MVLSAPAERSSYRRVPSSLCGQVSWSAIATLGRNAIDCDRLKVALIHYHLRIGGVSKVIGNQSAALTALGIEHLVLSAGPATAGIPHCQIDELDYQGSPQPKPNRLYQILLSACEKHLGGPPDLWHLHNPTLGKNLHFPRLIQALAESRTPLVLQPHDFAEDNRPSNYPNLTGQQIYPIAPQIHYAFINRRDQRLLEKAGLPQCLSNLLPNAVVPACPQSLDTEPSPSPLVLYPVRGIRRKNLGEVVLFSALAPTGTRFAISLAPENDAWKEGHARWELFVKQTGLPVIFNVTDRVPPHEGDASDYQTWLKRATHLLTTSIAEGFGLAFLEPALQGKPLLGRDLPEITADFRNQNIQPGRLYSRLPIPLENLDELTLRDLLRKRLQESYQQYGQRFHEEYLEEAWQNLTAGGSVDFGELPEHFQEKIVTEYLSGRADYLAGLRDWLHETLAETEPTTHPEQLDCYSMANSQATLQALYEKAFDSEAEAPKWLSKEAVLAQYLSPARFHFLRS